jgi:hypothetical protein
MDPMRARMASLTDEELQRVVTVEAGDWSAEGLEAAGEELRRRGVVSLSPPPPLPDADPRRPTMRAGIPIGILIVLLLKILLMLLR